jgi:hypothetical protein
MARKLSNFFTVGHRYKAELKRQIRSMIIITLGFTIAFSWRQTTFDLSQSFVQFITKIESSTASTVLTSTFITLIGVMLIFITAHYMKIEEHY